MLQHEQSQESLMKLIWLAIEPDIQNLVDRELRTLSKIPEFRKQACDLIRLRRLRRTTSDRTCTN